MGRKSRTKHEGKSDARSLSRSNGRYARSIAAIERPRTQKTLRILVILFLILGTIVVYWQVRNHDFLNYDDEGYVTENYHVQAGLTREGIVWAFTTFHVCNWHPLTWLSHMFDCHMYGLNSGGHHLTSLLFHVLNTLLLIVVLRRMTDSFWPSAFVAALFALHPLHVESVAWVAERKDVLSTFFWITTMWSYVLYVDRPGFGRYLLVLLLFALGLMAKPMLVTLPFVLLLLDYWPLGRLELMPSCTDNIQNQSSKYAIREGSNVLRLLWEKAPLFFLAVVSAVVTFVAQQAGGAVETLEVLPLDLRITNALVSYLRYIGKTLWPHSLAVFYPPLGHSLPMWQAIFSGLILLSVSVLAMRLARKYPYLIVGWLWYLGTLVPVIGVVQVGSQAMADRYTYVPLIGVFIIIAWGVRDLVSRWYHLKAAVLASVGVMFGALMICTWIQVSRWNNSISLFRHAVDVTVDNSLAYNNLGNALLDQDRIEEAMGHFCAALQIRPDDANAHDNLGLALAKQSRLEEAMRHFYEALRIKPDHVRAHYNLGVALASQGKPQNAMYHFSKAVEIKPDYAKAHLNLGAVLANQGMLKQAVDHFSEALRINPAFSEAKYNLKRALEDIRKRETVSDSNAG
jgi:tetratricopeptide (TPR) repeat protein